MSALTPATMPSVSPKRDIDLCFSNARRLSAGSHGNRWVVIIAPNGILINIPVPSRDEADKSLLRDVKAALLFGQESLAGLTITSINCTTGVQSRVRSFHAMLPLIPNLSYLVGAACLGSNVVVFEGANADFSAGCKNTDMLLVDEGMLPHLRPDWAAVALGLLRKPDIILFGRDGRLSKVDKVECVEVPKTREEKHD